MGIDGLWEVLQPARQIERLQELAIADGFERQQRTFKIGVDSDALMSQCVAGANSVGVHGVGPLGVLFYKLCKFLKSPVTMVFVFDGPSRPPKRGRKGVGFAPSWHGPCQSLVKAFGFNIHQAPGEAEAELAKMNQFGIIDAILTTDSDSFVFGAQCVMRSLSAQERKKGNIHSEEVSMYTADSIEHSDSILLNPGGLVFMAVSLVGDYSNGIKGCGPATALALARCGFGESLLDAAQTLDTKSFEDFRRNWLKDLRYELANNPHGYLSARQKRLASDIPDNFPEKSILDLYISPLTSFSPSQRPLDIKSLTSKKPPQIQLITSFCQTHLGWTNVARLLKVFHTSLWEGIFMQSLFTDNVRFDPKESILETPTLQIEVLRSQRKPRNAHPKQRLEDWNRVKFSTKNLVEAVGTTAGFLDDPGAVQNNTCVVWVPTCVLPLAMIMEHSRKTIVRNRKRQQHDGAEVIDVYPSPPPAKRATHDEVIDVYPSPPPVRRATNTDNAEVIDVYPSPLIKPTGQGQYDHQPLGSSELRRRRREKSAHSSATGGDGDPIIVDNDSDVEVIDFI